MKGRITTVASLLLAGALGVAGAGAATGTTAFDTIADHYEAIRSALLNDSTDGVQGHAQAIERQVEALTAQFDAGKASVSADEAGECEQLLPEILAAARSLAATKEIVTARAAFGELSKPMVRYREMVKGQRPMVVFCPMAKKSWLQPEGEIGNPYFGQKMARCGEVVSR